MGRPILNKLIGANPGERELFSTFFQYRCVDKCGIGDYVEVLQEACKFIDGEDYNFVTFVYYYFYSAIMSMGATIPMAFPMRRCAYAIKKHI